MNSRLLYLALFFFLSACAQDDDTEISIDEAPTFSYFQINDTDWADDHIHHNQEDAFKIRFNILDDNQIVSGRFSLQINGEESLTKVLDEMDNSSSGNYKNSQAWLNLLEFSYLQGVDLYEVQSGDQLIFTISATDNNDQTISKRFVVYID